MNANPTTPDTEPTYGPSGSPTLTGSQLPHAPHAATAAGQPLADSQIRHVPQPTSTVGDPPRDTDHDDSALQAGVVGAALSSNQPPTIRVPQPIPAASDGWLELRIWAEQFNDAQQARIAATNRAERGGVDPTIYHAYTEALAAAEKVCGLHMRRCFRRVVPAEIVAWQKDTLGVGEHLLARLLGHLGHPLHAQPHHWEGTGASRQLVADEPHVRTLAQLWQYAGHGAAGRPKKGATFEELAALGSPTLKMIVHLCAEACMKTRSSPFRPVYDDTRDSVADKVHTVECVRCGPSGKPAQIGSPWSAGHQHAHALRIVGKEILRDLWTVAGGSHGSVESHDSNAASGERSAA